MRKATTAATLSLLALGACMTVEAAGRQTNQQLPQEETTQTGLTAAIDRTTGRLRPLTQAETAELAAKAAAMRQASSQGITSGATTARQRTPGDGFTVHPDGTRSKRLPPDAMDQLTATRNRDGRISVQEGQDPRQERTEVSE